MDVEGKVLHKGLMKLLDEASFSLMAKEVPAFIKIYNWVKEMPETYQEKPDKKPVGNKPKASIKGTGK